MSGEYQYIDICPTDLQFSLAYHLDNSLYDLIEKNPNLEAKITFDETNTAVCTFILRSSIHFSDIHFWNQQLHFKRKGSYFGSTRPPLLCLKQSR